MTPLRLLVIGAGANVWRVFHSAAVDAIGATVVAVTDPDEAGARRVAEDCACAVAADVEALLRHDADAAVILAPHVDHAELAIRCLRAGRHVLVEKPMAVTATDAERMVAAAQDAGRILAVALQQRAGVPTRAAIRLLDAGELGEIQRADVLCCWPRRTGYFATGAWRGTWAGEGGGILINQGQHALDLLCRLAGLPATVFGRTSSAIHGLEVEDTAAALLTWANGATGALHVTTAQVGPQLRIEITGTRGRLRLEPDRLEVWRAAVDFREYASAPGNPYAPPETSGPETVTGPRGSHADVYRNLAAAIAGREPLIAPGWDAAGAVELANAVVMSARERAEVALPVDRVAYARMLEGLRRLEPAAAETGSDGGGGA